MAGESMTLSELESKIAKRAWQDPAFEAEFMADPKGTFEKFLQQKLPEELSIHAHYNTPNEIHFVIPRRKALPSDELTDEDLERVAGGETPFLTFGIMASIVVGALSIKNAVMGTDW